jgi:hypothetical protein
MHVVIKLALLGLLALLSGLLWFWDKFEWLALLDYIAQRHDREHLRDRHDV